MKASKKLTSKSGLTIPKQLRADIGFVPGMAVDIETTSQGILIKPHAPTCRFCGEITSVKTVQGISICKDCAAILRQELEDKHGD